MTSLRFVPVVLPGLILAFVSAACGSKTNDPTDPNTASPNDKDSGADAAEAGLDGNVESPSDGGEKADGGAVTVTGDFCVEDGWCWQRPLPFGASLASAWGSGPNDVWAVGARGTIVHYDGTAWKIVPSGTHVDLTCVSGTSGSDVWAVGARGTLLHFDGATWSPKTSPTTQPLSGVHAVSASDVYVVGDADTRMHFDGTTWSILPTVYPSAATRPNQNGVWASTTGEVWSVGEPYLMTVPHRTGGTWTTTEVEYTSSSSTSFRSVWGSNANDVWMTGDPGGVGALQHWNGTKWSNVYPPSASLFAAPALTVTGSGPKDVWFFGGWQGSGHWDGTAFVPQPDLQYEYLTGGWVHPSGEGWAIGYGGRLAHKTSLNGGWTFTSGSPHGAYDSLARIFVINDSDIWSVGRLSLVHWNGTEWSDVPAANTVYRQEFDDVWGSGPNDVWATSWGSDAPDNLQHWNGTEWTVTPHPGPNYLDAIWGSAANDVWVSCDGGGMHFDGAAWTATASGPGGQTIHGSAKNDVWSAGENGVIRHFDGTSWTNKTSGTTDDLYAVRAFGPNDAWVAGANGAIRHWNGVAWSAVPAPPFDTTMYNARSITDLAGASSNDLWAATSTGEIFHWNGTTWTRSAWLAVGLSSIARTPSGALLAAGGNGAILRRGP